MNLLSSQHNIFKKINCLLSHLQNNIVHWKFDIEIYIYLNTGKLYSLFRNGCQKYNFTYTELLLNLKGFNEFCLFFTLLSVCWFSYLWGLLAEIWRAGKYALLVSSKLLILNWSVKGVVLSGFPAFGYKCSLPCWLQGLVSQITKCLFCFGFYIQCLFWRGRQGVRYGFDWSFVLFRPPCLWQ